MQGEVSQLLDGMTAESAARERELLERIRRLEFALRARPLIEDSWTRDPAGDAGPGPLQAARRALEIATQDTGVRELVRSRRSFQRRENGSRSGTLPAVRRQRFFVSRGRWNSWSQIPLECLGGLRALPEVLCVMGRPMATILPGTPVPTCLLPPLREGARAGGQERWHSVCRKSFALDRRGLANRPASRPRS